VNSLKTYITALSKTVQADVAEILASKPFGILFDAWTEGGTHFVAAIAVTPDGQDASKAAKYLLCFTPFRDETKMDADAFIELFDFILQIYDLKPERFCFVVCDHAAVNGAFASRVQVPMIGCASHRLQLAVKEILAPHEKQRKKVHELMVKLDSIKNRAKLEAADALMPVQRNATRWSSTFSMVQRYFEIVDFIDRSDIELDEACLTAREEVRLQAIFDDLKDIESINKTLQIESAEDGADVAPASNDKTTGGKKRKRKAVPTLATVRTLFNGMVQAFPESKGYLEKRASEAQLPKSDVVKNAAFENAIVKVLSGCESKLTVAEARTLDKFMREDESSDEEEEEQDLSFADGLLEGEDGNQSSPRPSFIDLRWIPATSDEVERLFSRAGLVFSERRQGMFPISLEKLMLLEWNSKLWACIPSRARSVPCQQRISRSMTINTIIGE
jgi:hypothetical protein